MARSNSVWFPAKRYGWGWGLPCNWKGWVVLIAYLGAIVATILQFSQSTDHVVLLTRIVPITLAFLAICWLKGERPRWRWGGD